MESPISKLPREVLEKIFISHCNIYRLDCEGRQYKLRSRHEIDRAPILAQVCRAWHSIAMDFGELWSYVYIPSYPVRQLEDYLTRSKSSSLTAHATIWPRVRDPYVNKRLKLIFRKKVAALQHHMQRVKHLAIYTDHGEVWDLMSEITNVLFPTAVGLKSLSICANAASQEMSLPLEFSIFDPPSTVPEILLAGCLPRQPSFREKTSPHLTLAKVRMDPLQFCETMALLAPRLKSLRLLQITLSTRRSSDPIPGLVRFHGLSDLCLDMDFVDHTSLLNLIDLSIGFNVFSTIRFSIANAQLLQFYLRRHFNTLHLTDDEVQMIIDPENDCLYLNIGKYSGRIVCKPIDGSIWPLCKEVFALLHHAISITSLKSFKLTFLRTESKKYKAPLDNDGTSHVAALNALLKKADSLQRVSVLLQGMPEENEKIFSNVQEVIIEALASGRSTADLHTVTLKGFNFGSAKFLSTLEKFMSNWNHHDAELLLGNPRDLTDEILKSICDFNGSISAQRS